MVKRRNVVYDRTFDEQARLIEPNVQRFDEIIEGAEWLIAHHPEKCPVIYKTLRVAFTDQFPGSPSLRIYFQIKDEHTCVVHWVEPLEPEDEFLGL